MEIMMDTYKKIREHISSLSDGELSASDLELAFAALHSPDGHHAWTLYHRIGDELRAQPSPGLSEGFSERLAARLAAEPAHSRQSAPNDSVAADAVTAPAVATSFLS
jgi:sigma-E factor negative regulatory protein RseA